MTEGSWPEDTRGILNPAAMRQVVDFARYPAGRRLSGIVDWFWSVAWTLPAGAVHIQEILNHPSGHVSVGTVDDTGIPLDPGQGRVYGVLTGLSQRRLTGTGWTVAAKTTTGGLGVLLDAPARDLTDQETGLDTILTAPAAQRLVDDINDVDEAEVRVELLKKALASVVDRRPPEHLAEARMVADVAALAETNRSVCRVEQLAGAANVSVRSLQRLFDTHVGVSPAWVIRRWRIIEAAEQAVAHDNDDIDSWPGWSTVSTNLGYADQSHLIREFQRYLGESPDAYRRRLIQAPT